MLKDFKLNMSVMPQAVLLVIVLFTIQPYNVDAVYTMNETCQYYGNGYIGNPDNCQGWGYCQNGVLAATGLCNSGYLYDMSSATCNVQSQVTCKTSITNACSTLSAPQIIMNPDNCQQYCYCSSSISPDCGSCPTNQIFDANSQACIWNTNNLCPVDSVCRLVPNNAFVGDPNNCGGYLTCESGLGVAGTCSSGKGYNPLTGYCTSSYGCDGNDAGINENLAANPAVCSAYTTDTQFFSDGQTCFGFYFCSSTTGPGSWGKCLFGTHFDNTTQECVTPYAVACPYNRCGNVNLSFVDTVGTSCEQYTVCTNQMSGTSSKCSDVNKNYPYFNEYYGTCVTTNPGFAVCTT